MLIARSGDPGPGTASRRLIRLLGGTGDTAQADPEVMHVGVTDDRRASGTAPPGTGLACPAPDEPDRALVGTAPDRPDQTLPPASRDGTGRERAERHGIAADEQVRLLPATGAEADPPTNASPARSVGAGRTSTARQVVAAFGLTGARLEPGRAAVRALAVVAGVVVLLAGALAWWSQPRPEPVALPTPTATSRPEVSASGVVVAVAGKVRRPGLVTVPAGARVADAIDAAGGLLPDTDVGLLNLARKVSDGELIVVGATPPPGAAAEGAGTSGDPQAKVNLNTATTQQLDTLPGVGPVLAQRILEHRDRHGGFRSVSDLQRVDGIGPARYEQLKELVTV